MVSWLVGSVLGLAQAQPSFAEVEKNKYEALTKLTNFSGTYNIVVVPSEGAGVKQVLNLLFTPVGRSAKIVVNGLPQMDMAWTAKERWIILYGERRYNLQTAAADFPLTNPYSPLPVEDGSANLSIEINGIRFGAKPEPKVTEVKTEDVAGKSLRRITSKGSNPQSGGEMTFVQWFDGQGWLLRKFELELKGSDGKKTTIKGELVNDSDKPNAGESAFKLPETVRNSFTRITG